MLYIKHIFILTKIVNSRIIVKVIIAHSNSVKKIMKSKD